MGKNMNQFVGKIVETDIGNFKITEASEAGFTTKKLTDGEITVRKYKVKPNAALSLKQTISH